MKENEYSVKVECGNCRGVVTVVGTKGEILPKKTRCSCCECEISAPYKYITEVIRQDDEGIAATTEKPKNMDVIQINTKPKMAKAKFDKRGQMIENAKVVVPGKKYFCITPEEQQVFSENNPGVETETFKVELPVFIANRYLNDPENKKQFTVKEKAYA